MSFVFPCRLLGLDLVPRIEGEMADVEQISPVELFNIHEQSTVNSQEATVSTIHIAPIHTLGFHCSCLHVPSGELP